MIKENIFADSSWIWYTAEPQADSYGNFTDKFLYESGTAICHISCDGDYTLFVNGKYAASNQYGDFEHYKIYDSIDITDKLIPGENSIFILVWHLGIGTSRYQPGRAGVMYSIECGGTELSHSDKHTLSRQDPGYKSGYRKMVTVQLGQSFWYDASAPNDNPYHESVIVEKSCPMYNRPVPKLELLDEKPVHVLIDNGDHYLFDLGEETVGLPVMRFSSESRQKITVCWGEHIIDGSVRRYIGNRDFSFEYTACPGFNSYTNYMLRLGCRYLEVFCEEPIDVEYIGLIPQVYPVETKPKTFGNELDQQIYDLCVNTLRLCMMEHYVDTPWREQCLYVYDAKNQMLCGYSAFKDGNSSYARANLKLISEDNRTDGLLSITYPSGGKLAIPSFSLHYYTSIREYLESTGDLSLGYEVYDKLISVIKTFEGQIKDGVLCSFEGSEYWNFYDWSPFMDNPIGSTGSRPDLMINCLFVIAIENMKIISNRLGRNFDCSGLVESIKSNTKSLFFCSEDGLFSMSSGEKQYTELGNAAAVLAGLTTESENQVIGEKLLSGELAECSLSMKCFKYDALLKIDPEYRCEIIEEIRTTYGIMLENGATSVWEVIGGAEAFGKAGSLCHGWSAVPILYL